MKSWLAKCWPLATGALILLATSAIILYSSLRHNQGRLVYALDDPYIHMAIAKNFAAHSVWGVTQYQFSNSSSSPLWTLLISLFYFLFGINETTPFILNLIIAAALVFWIYRILERFQVPNFYKLIVLVALIYFTPLPTLVFSGQEHILHALLTILFAHFAAQELSDISGSTKKRRLDLVILAPALSSIRYEGLFLAALVCLLFLFRRHWFFSILLAVFALLPPVIYGFLSMSKGWFFFPNPILVKSMLLALPGQKNIFGLLGFLAKGGYQLLLVTSHIAFLLISALLIYAVRWRVNKRFWDRSRILLLLFIGSALLHVTFANAGWFFRYEAYLVAFGLFAVSFGIFDSLSEWKQESAEAKAFSVRYAIILFAALIPIYPLAKRGLLALEQTRTATTNIYEQQYQMGLFLKEFYPGAAVAANDIGAICFLSDVRCLDLWGLGSKETAILRISGYFGPEEIYALTAPMDAIIIYEHSFADIMPARWIKAGQWKISNNIVAAGDSVTFFAPDLVKAARLMGNLRAFFPRLPKTVVQSGKYLEYIPQ